MGVRWMEQEEWYIRVFLLKWYKRVKTSFAHIYSYTKCFLKIYPIESSDHFTTHSCDNDKNRGLSSFKHRRFSFLPLGESSRLKFGYWNLVQWLRRSACGLRRSVHIRVHVRAYTILPNAKHRFRWSIESHCVAAEHDVHHWHHRPIHRVVLHA
jgi:hypothetical protein